MTDNNPSTWKYYDWSDTQRKRIVSEDSVGLGIVFLLVGLAPFIAVGLGLYLITRGVISGIINRLFGRKTSTRRRRGWLE